MSRAMKKSEEIHESEIHEVPTSEPAVDLPTDEAAIEDRIRVRAFELYMDRGCADGLDLDDWLQAESEVRNAQ
jgi:DUF2934 family protein